VTILREDLNEVPRLIALARGKDALAVQRPDPVPAPMPANCETCSRSKAVNSSTGSGLLK
jgi:hypothetical protein